MSRILLTGPEGEDRIETRPGDTLLEALRRAGHAPAAPCGGQGKCGKCLVKLSFQGEERLVRACRSPVPGDCRVELLPEGTVTGEGSLAPPAPSPGRLGLGAALDLGSTTLALSLYDLATGKELGRELAWNCQAPYGADVISRCKYIKDRGDGLERLSGLIRRQSVSLLRGLCLRAGRDWEELSELYAVGNTVMEHIFAGLSPVSIASAPFMPLSRFEEDGGFELEGLRVFCAPCVSGYVGGDVTAGLLAAGLHQREGNCLYLDLGTNGEMALGGNGGFLCCSAACGPAFEGAGISCGMTGTQGAVSRARWGPLGPELQVIGGGPARGLCGSGLLDVAAMALARGLADESGRLLPPEEAPEEVRPWLEEDENGNGSFVFSREHRLSLRAGDLRALQLAKAAVAAGIRLIIKRAGLGFEDIDRVYIAGGFGSFMDTESAAVLGLIPRELLGRCRCLGNAALAGAATALLRPEKRGELLALEKSCGYIELSTDPDFNDEFIERLSFD